MTPSPWTLSMAALTLTGALGACGGAGGDHPAPGRDTTAAMSADSAAPAAAAGPARVEGFQAPESAKYDAELDVWYVANINGSPRGQGRQRLHLAPQGRRHDGLAQVHRRAARTA